MCLKLVTGTRSVTQWISLARSQAGGPDELLDKELGAGHVKKGNARRSARRTTKGGYFPRRKEMLMGFFWVLYLHLSWVSGL